MARIVPAEWMSRCDMQRVIGHWTGGAYQPSALDLSHYHIVIDGEGKLHRGSKPIAANLSTRDGVYAAHTLGANTGSIGVAICGMGGAWKFPRRDGKYPITRAAWNSFLLVCADLCDFYRLAPIPTELLMHSEAGKFLGRPQKGKWDIDRLCFDRGQWAKVSPGDEMRTRTGMLLRVPVGR